MGESAGVLGMLGLLIDTTELTPVQDDYARTALSSGHALLSLVNDILDLSKIESGCMELETVPFSPTDVMDGILSMFGERSRGKNLELCLLVESSVPPMVMGDPDRFRQILINLIGNSVKFCNRGHIFVRIMALPETITLPVILKRFHDGRLVGRIDTSEAITGLMHTRDLPVRTDESRGMACKNVEEGEKGKHGHNRFQTLSGYEVCDVDCCWPSIDAASDDDLPLADKHCNPNTDVMRLLVWVEDSGIGIPEAAKDRIFKPFMQADKSTSRTYGGTGIGLSISKKLTELMAGKLDFTSHVNKGTTFRLDIQVQALPPIAKSHASIPPPGVLSPPTLALHPPPTARALCIDNNALRAEIICSYLRRIGMTAESLVLSFPPTFSDAHHASAVLPPNEEPMVGRPGLPKLLPPDVIFLELEPSGGGWGEGIARCEEDGQQKTEGPPSKAVENPMRVSELERRLAWARDVAGVRANHRDKGNNAVPVILISNTQDVAMKADAERVGFAGIVVKPLRKATLIACLREGLWQERTGKMRQLLEEKSGSSERGPSCPDWLAGRCIMVVDDNAVNRKVASKVLEKFKFVVACFASAEDALRVLTDSHEFDLVFTDIQMPGMDGHEMARAIRSAEREGQSKCPWCAIHRRGVPIFAMTADIMKGSLERCTKMGMDGMVPKPIEERRLLQAIVESLQPCDKTPAMPPG